MTKVDILAVGIHPDDVELSCSGTLMKHASEGKTFGILDLSRGELGTRGDAQTRSSEALAAAGLLGASFREQLQIPDGFFTLTPEHWMPVVRVVRQCKPEIVLCNAPDDRHPDHARAAQLVLEACFYSGLAKIETAESDSTPQTKWRPRAVYHYIQDKHLEPDFIVDITPFIERKMEAILAFRSQFWDPDSKEPETPISGKQFLDFMKAKNRVFGRSIQVEYAEGFKFSRIPGIDSLFHLI